MLSSLIEKLDEIEFELKQLYDFKDEKDYITKIEILFSSFIERLEKKMIYFNLKKKSFLEDFNVVINELSLGVFYKYSYDQMKSMKSIIVKSLIKNLLDSVIKFNELFKEKKILDSKELIEILINCFAVNKTLNKINLNAEKI